MNKNALDKSGIKCLAGFAFQIKVFSYYALLLQKDEFVEFETIEDMNEKERNN